MTFKVQTVSRYDGFLKIVLFNTYTLIFLSDEIDNLNNFEGAIKSYK